MTTTTEFLEKYDGYGARELKAAMAEVRRQEGALQVAAQAVAGYADEGIDVLTVFAAWVQDEMCGEPARPLTEVSGCGA